MQKKTIQFGLISLIIIIISACTSWSYSKSKPEKRYTAMRDGEIYYSFLAPEGNWRIFHGVADTRARYTIGANLNPYVYYSVDISMGPINNQERIPRVKDIIDRGDYQKYLDDQLYSENFKRNTKEVGKQNVYGKLIKISSLQCKEIGWDNHHGPRPDSWNPELAGLGFYQKKAYISCLLRKEDHYRGFSIVVFFNIADKHLKAEDRHKYNLTPDMIEADFRWRLQRTFDSFDFYGYSQE